jgi:hypothetical protein
MKALYLVLGGILLGGGNAQANDNSSTCHFLPKTDAPDWVNKDIRDDSFYYAVGGASGKTANGFLPINELINQARQDAIENLSRSIRSSVKVSTKRTIESQKKGKSKAEVRKEVKLKSELVSQTALTAVIDDSRWLDNDNCLLWYRVKVSKQGAEFAVKSYVSQVEKRLTKRIDELTKREIEQILSDNGFAPTTVDATRALLNNSTAIYRGQEYNIADLYQQSGFDWLEEQQSQVFKIRYANKLFYNGVTGLNVPMSVVVSGSSSEKIIQALSKLHSFGIELNQAKVTIGKQYHQIIPFAENQQYNIESYVYFASPRPQKQGNREVTSYIEPPKALKKPYLYNFGEHEGSEEFGLVHVIALEHRIDLIEPLSRIGVSLDTQSKHGYTALALAIELENLEFAHALISSGAQKNQNNEIAYKVALLLQHLNQYATNETASTTSVNLHMLNNLTEQLSPSKNVAVQIKKQVHAFAPMKETLNIFDNGNWSSETRLNGVQVND